ncbi:PorP/SprF family type IX secretion system membrane protein [Polluticoccus soli]|uniref:PorP/SprF family type IX secretion system membrane protein n=1 Tax=Polluticoccus soli TaxID=3034150 RepID=UPI0023E1DBE2|nr:PorP/SprF family type IX secretion system membrane protein [Flavipsychrobacter sp. JY13-12]
MKFNASKRLFFTAATAALFCSNQVHAQGMHFSQYYNAPMLVNPANTGLMSDNDYRLGANYRNQWANLPVPYNTISAYADFQLMRNANYNNWMGLGVSFFNDKAGDGVLSNTRIEGNIAYHVMTSDYSMISAGVSVANAARSLNFNKLTYNSQWVGRNGVTFDPQLNSNEPVGILKTNFFDVSAGINYATFPTEATYLRIGVSVAHINQAEESFYDADTLQVAGNKIGIRPSANADAIINWSESLTFNPSVYYTLQKNASQIVFGSLGMIYVGGQRDHKTELIVGAFYRWDDAVIGALGMQFNSVRIMTSYDYTISSLGKDNNNFGAIEFSVSYMGMYGNMGRSGRTINCPRF